MERRSKENDMNGLPGSKKYTKHREHFMGLRPVILYPPVCCALVAYVLCLVGVAAYLGAPRSDNKTRVSI